MGIIKIEGWVEQILPHTTSSCHLYEFSTLIFSEELLNKSNTPLTDQEIYDKAADCKHAGRLTKAVNTEH